MPNFLTVTEAANYLSCSNATIRKLVHFLTVTEAANYLSCSNATIRKLVHEGELAAIRLNPRPGANWRIPMASIDLLLERGRVVPKDAPIHKLMDYRARTGSPMTPPDSDAETF